MLFVPNLYQLAGLVLIQRRLVNFLFVSTWFAEMVKVSTDKDNLGNEIFNPVKNHGLTLLSLLKICLSCSSDNYNFKQNWPFFYPGSHLNSGHFSLDLT